MQIIRIKFIEMRHRIYLLAVTKLTAYSRLLDHETIVAVGRIGSCSVSLMPTFLLLFS